MEILELDNEVAEAMINVFGTKIFKYRNGDRNDTISATLNDYVILKCHGFDGSVRVELGAKMFILENKHYWRIVIE